MIDILETLPSGKQQTMIEERYDLIPRSAISALARTFAYGADKYGEWNHRGIPAESSINHAIAHLYNYLETYQEEELAHALTRLAMAYDCAYISKELSYQ